jgi:hypothetical protein
VQFLGHEVYGLQLLSGLLEFLFPEADQRGRVQGLIRWHHVHHQIGQRYKTEPARLTTLIEGLRTLDPANEELRWLGKSFDPSSPDYQPDFPLLILLGYVDSLACRGPDTKAPITDVARIDLALLTLAALYPRLRAREQTAQRGREEASRLFREASDQLQAEDGKQPGAWKRRWESAIMPELRPWYEDQRLRRERDGQPGPSLDEVLDQARAILRERT